MEVDAFEKWLFEEGKAASTISSYVTDVKGFQSYLEKTGHAVQSLKRTTFLSYRDYLEKDGFAVSTINKKVNSLKVFNDFMKLNGYCTDIVISLKRDRIQIATGSELDV